MKYVLFPLVSSYYKCFSTTVNIHISINIYEHELNEKKRRFTILIVTKYSLTELKSENYKKNTDTQQ